MKTEIDHLVVLAADLEAGVHWCEAVLGITPGPGGEHELYGTHNRLFKIATPENPLAYLEIIAINPHAVRPKKKQPTRWFDMDDEKLRADVAPEPRIVHFVASTPDLLAARMALRMVGIDRGPAVHASRRTSKGVLNWQISVRADGQRLFNGALPSLIQWGKPVATDPLRLHPRNSQPRSGVTLHSLGVQHPSFDMLQAAFVAIGLSHVEVTPGAANITATLNTPKGLVKLQSHGI
jgi:hypothetical protein